MATRPRGTSCARAICRGCGAGRMAACRSGRASISTPKTSCRTRSSDPCASSMPFRQNTSARSAHMSAKRFATGFGTRCDARTRRPAPTALPDDEPAGDPSPLEVAVGRQTLGHYEAALAAVARVRPRADCRPRRARPGLRARSRSCLAGRRPVPPGSRSAAPCSVLPRRWALSDQPDDAWLIALGTDVSDGSTVDWDLVAGRAPNDEARTLVDNLKRLEAVIQGHRSAGSDAGRRSRRTPAPRQLGTGSTSSSSSPSAPARLARSIAPGTRKSIGRLRSSCCRLVARPAAHH